MKIRYFYITIFLLFCVSVANAQNKIPFKSQEARVKQNKASLATDNDLYETSDGRVFFRRSATDTVRIDNDDIVRPLSASTTITESGVYRIAAGGLTVTLADVADLKVKLYDPVRLTETNPITIQLANPANRITDGNGIQQVGGSLPVNVNNEIIEVYREEGNPIDFFVANENTIQIPPVFTPNGTYDAATNTPDITQAANQQNGSENYVYAINVAGTAGTTTPSLAAIGIADGTELAVGDQLFWYGTTWFLDKSGTKLERGVLANFLPTDTDYRVEKAWDGETLNNWLERGTRIQFVEATGTPVFNTDLAKKDDPVFFKVNATVDRPLDIIGYTLMQDISTGDPVVITSPFTLEKGSLYMAVKTDDVSMNILKVGSDASQVPETFTSIQVINEWNGNQGISNGAHSAFDLGFDYTVGEYIELFFKKDNSWEYSTKFKLPLISHNLAHYYNDQYQWVRAGSNNNTIEIRSVSEAGHNLSKVIVYSNAANGYVIPSATISKTQIDLTVNAGANNVNGAASTKILEGAGDHALLIQLPANQMIDLNNITFPTGVTGVVRDALTGELLVTVADGTGNVDLTIPFIARPTNEVYFHTANEAALDVAPNANSYFGWTPDEPDNSGITKVGNDFIVPSDGVYAFTATIGQWNTSGNEAWTYLILDLYDASNTFIREVARVRSRTIEVDGTGNKSGNGLSVTGIAKMTIGQKIRPRYQQSQTSQVLTRAFSMYKITTGN